MNKNLRSEYPDKENVRKKMRKFTFVFRKLFREVSHLAATIFCTKKLVEFSALREFSIRTLFYIMNNNFSSVFSHFSQANEMR